MAETADEDAVAHDVRGGYAVAGFTRTTVARPSGELFGGHSEIPVDVAGRRNLSPCAVVVERPEANVLSAESGLLPILLGYIYCGACAVVILFAGSSLVVSRRLYRFVQFSWQMCHPCGLASLPRHQNQMPKRTRGFTQ